MISDRVNYSPVRRHNGRIMSAIYDCFVIVIVDRR